MADVSIALQDQEPNEKVQMRPLHPTPLTDAVHLIFSSYKRTKKYFGAWKAYFDFAEGTLSFFTSAIDICLVSPCAYVMGGRPKFNKKINSHVKTANRKCHNAREYLLEGFKTFWSSEFEIEDDWFYNWWMNTEVEKKKKRKGSNAVDGKAKWKIGSTSELDGEDSMASRSMEWDSVELEDGGHLSTKARKGRRTPSHSKRQGIEGSGDSHGSDEESVTSTSSERDPWWRRVFRRQGQRSRVETKSKTEHEGSPKKKVAVKSTNVNESKGTVHPEIMKAIAREEQPSETDSKLNTSLSNLETENHPKDTASLLSSKGTVKSTENLKMDTSVNSQENKVLPEITVSPSISDTESQGHNQTDESQTQ